MKIAFLGDSITFGYGLCDRSQRFSTRICREMAAEEANFGITGTLMARAGLSRSDGTAFVDRVHLTDGADFTVVFGGTNDYFWSDHPIAGEGMDAFERAAEEICRAVSKRPALIVTPYPHHGIGNFRGGSHWRESSEHDTDQLNFCGHRLEEYADVLEAHAKRHGIPVLNLHKTPGFDWRVCTSDGCHPNPAGHAWLADVIGREIRSILKGTPT